MSVSSNAVNFGLNGGTQTFTIQAAAGFEITGKTGTFFTYTVNENTVTVNVQSTTSNLSRSGEISIMGCNETLKVKIIQENQTGINDLMEGKIKVMPNPVSGHQITISIPENLNASHARFTDLNGKLIYEKKLTLGDNTINIRFPNGLYLLNISGPEVNYTTKITVN